MGLMTPEIRLFGAPLDAPRAWIHSWVRRELTGIRKMNFAIQFSKQEGKHENAGEEMGKWKMKHEFQKPGEMGKWRFAHGKTGIL